MNEQAWIADYAHSPSRELTRHAKNNTNIPCFYPGGFSGHFSLIM
jgi:hypothetical protein